MAVEKWSDADKKRYEDNKAILTALKELTERVTSLEAETAILRAENEQLKQNTQQGNMTLFQTSTLSLITSLVGIEYDTLGYRTLERCLGHKGIQKIQHFARVALSKVHKNENAGEYAYKIAHIVARETFDYGVAEELVAEWNKELENKTVFEIVEMISQMMNGTILQNENQGPQR